MVNSSSLNATYDYAIPMGYLHEGTKALMVHPSGQSILITADMDGHIVSPNYGRMYDPGRAPQPREYINITIDAFKNSYRGKGGNQNWVHPNDTSYEDEGWEFRVSKTAWNKYLDDRSKYKGVQREEEKNLQRAEALEMIRKAEADLAKARRTLERVE